jgi:predicted phage-related endonuclease
MTKCKNSCPLDKFDGCCVDCGEWADCPDVCERAQHNCTDAIFEGTGLEVLNVKAAAVIQKIGELVTQKAEIEKAEKEMREQLKQAMDAHGVESFDNDMIKVTYVEASTRTSVDSTKLKAQQPDIYAKYSKTSDVSAFVKITLKEKRR